MKSDKLFDAIGEARSEYVQDAEVKPAVRKYGWVKWAAVAACLVLAALIAIPAILHSNAQADTAPDRSLPAEAFISDNARKGIRSILTSPGHEFISEEEFASVTLGLPIAEYGLYLNDTDEYCLYASEYSQVYPVYINGALVYLVGCGSTGAWGYYEPYLATKDYEKEPLQEEVFPWHQELYDKLAAGNAGSVALVYAADGTYLYDGSTFKRVSDTGIGINADYDAQFDENGNYIDWPIHAVEPPQKLNPAALEGANLPYEVIAEIRLTDTSVTEQLI